MELLIFRTDIKSKKKVRSLKPVLNNHSDIIKWSIDLEDIDNVLRIEATTNLSEGDVIDLVEIQGFYIKTLSD
ncbi:hypothetical protein IWQ47_001660 [Aquimarina sp. EL_43]|uniref:hypothetical protein n=1 Tax=Aquimarina TaxID=290174 RepID=UPI00046ED588|nr:MULTISPECIES: hypothetical protein [Aquimarina]MBG6130257.1 hypothetical protein [Aquimarina sp. EL_35]MBG6149037.1 hypothetical protein [Aquimarina sp. EL_32]MBG6168589.1 hypothetical protein [Aquimarina sp. EL_43]